MDLLEVLWIFSVFFLEYLGTLVLLEEFFRIYGYAGSFGGSLECYCLFAA